MSEATQRIISHMNADHQLALLDYLVVYGKIDAASIVESTLGISAIDETLLTIDYQTKGSSAFKQWTAAWNDCPENDNVKISGLRDLKGKLVAMAHYAAKKQGYAHKRITKVVGPQGSHFMYAIFLSLVLNAYNPAILRSFVSRDAVIATVVSYMPGFLVSLYELVERQSFNLFLTVYGIHIFEILYFTVPTIKKYRIPAKQALQWISLHFFEGYYVVRRLNALKSD